MASCSFCEYSTSCMMSRMRGFKMKILISACEHTQSSHCFMLRSGCTTTPTLGRSSEVLLETVCELQRIKEACVGDLCFKTEQATAGEGNHTAGFFNVQQVVDLFLVLVPPRAFVLEGARDHSQLWKSRFGHLSAGCRRQISYSS